MRNALLKDTREVSVSGHMIHQPTDAGLSLAPLGRNTETAVDLGLKFMEAGLIEIALHRYESMFHEKAVLVLTGGDSPVVQSLVKSGAMLIPELVLDGLALVLP
jgi:type III pantothenate kinase